jgi:nucleoside-diphosphate-sugar epimerase
MRVLVTGAAGYIGSVLIRRLLSDGIGVLAIDNLTFGGSSLLPMWSDPQLEFRNLDLRDGAAVRRCIGEAGALDAVVHLAAIVGDPACQADPDLATAVNWDATRALARAATESGVQRFVFVSTCSNYGVIEDDALADETTRLNPASHYARLKVKAETYLLEEHDWRGGAPVVLRLATAHGMSPRMRLDLTVNEFAMRLARGEELEVFAARTWRPYCHVADIAAAVRLVLAAPAAQVAAETFNVGSTEENHTKEVIAEKAASACGTGRIRYRDGGPDPRNYRVDFAKIRRTLGFACSRTVDDTIADVIAAVRERILDPHSPAHRNA